METKSAAFVLLNRFAVSISATNLALKYPQKAFQLSAFDFEHLLRSRLTVFPYFRCVQLGIHRVSLDFKSIDERKLCVDLFHEYKTRYSDAYKYNVWRSQWLRNPLKQFPQNGIQVFYLNLFLAESEKDESETEWRIRVHGCDQNVTCQVATVLNITVMRKNVDELTWFKLLILLLDLYPGLPYVIAWLYMSRRFRSDRCLALDQWKRSFEGNTLFWHRKTLWKYVQEVFNWSTHDFMSTPQKCDDGIMKPKFIQI